MRAKVILILCAVLAGLTLPPVTFAQSFTHNILMIHGRSDSEGEQFGVFTTDQHGYWGGSPTTADGHVYFVQWDAWNRGFDDTTCPGGECIIKNAVNGLCNASNNQECWIICHSAGCPAFENYLAKSDYATNTLLFAHVMAASSAAGGSELADIVAGFGQAIDKSLTTTNARSVYDHNNMQGVMVRGFSGTNNNLTCLFFPSQSGSGLNPDCTSCFGRRQCADGVVALHSTCGHNRVGSFQDCNSTLFPNNDTAGTYAFHGWWITDQECVGRAGTGCNWSGPYSAGAPWNSTFKTYRVNHSGGADLAIAEYSAAPFALCP